MHITREIKVDFGVTTNLQLYDGLLMVVGEHKAGKTALLNSIKEGNYEMHLSEDFTTYSLFLKNQTTMNKDIVRRVFSADESQWEEELDGLVKETFSNQYYNSIKERISCISCLVIDTDIYVLSYQRLVMLALLTKLAQKEKMIILVDEPEQFAHPLLVRETCVLFRRLLDSGSILIMSTNSEIIVNNLFTDVEQVARLETVDNKQIIKQPNAIEIVKKVQEFYSGSPFLRHRFSNSKQVDYGLSNVVDNYTRIYLASVLRDEIFTIMFSKYMVLGEGSSEDVLFDYIEQIFHPDWSRDLMVNYLGCLGKGTMPFYFVFLNAIGIGTICMYDYDNDTNPVHVSYAEAFSKYEKENYHLFRKFVLEPDLERVLDIEPNYKLMPIEKPVNIFHETFITESVKDKVGEFVGLFESMIMDMERRKKDA